MTKKNPENNTTEFHKKKYLPIKAFKRNSLSMQNLYLETLGIDEKTVSYTLTQKDEKSSEDVWQFVREHSKPFPTVDSHYCRKNTCRKYLEKDLSIKKMYDLYKQKCQKEERTPVKYWLYDKIFGNEFNIYFHHPKKMFVHSLTRMKKYPQRTRGKNT